ncbi:putative transcription factor GeBP family [Medicago truncatula]|uniref:Putative transcription factor GeBP family n=1 Tax=Medicago truncatula TaxID=3880 RepID=G7I7E7_MEDTR|nr:probable transcription factor At3g04930 [Medicago truncatula]AES61283.2 transcription regulator [Medicago truncatula]RHN80691.1 putative transcription factor GeBP family [Medicago truncatula]
MAFSRNGVVIPTHDEHADIEEEDDDDLEEEDNYFVQPNTDHHYQTEQSPSTFATAAVPTSVILALPHASASATTIDGSPEPKREPMEEKTSDSRKLFQRIWTEEDEITILQGFLDYNANRESSYHNDTGSFYDHMKGKIQLDFTKSQLVDKLRRLKKKYRTALQKFDSGKDFGFKSTHDQAAFEISHKIWNINGNSTPIGVPVEEDDEIIPNPNPNSSHLAEKKAVQSRKRSRAAEEERHELNDSKDNHQNNSGNTNSSNVDENREKSNGNHVHNVPGLIEETVKSCLTPVLKELSNATMSGSPFGFGGRGFGAGGFSMNTVPLGFLNLGSGEKAVDDKWRKQQILELEVYSKRLELVQDEVKAAIEELRSNAGAGGAGGSGNNTNQ